MDREPKRLFWQNDGPSESAREALLVALKGTLARDTDPEHFLIALLDDSDSALAKACLKLMPALNPKALRQAIIAAVQRVGVPAAIETWSDKLLSPRSQDTLTALTTSAAWIEADPTRRQRQLSAAFLRAAHARVRRAFGYAGAPDADLLAELERLTDPVQRMVVFPDNEILNLDAFDHNARTVLELVKTEGKSLGLSRTSMPLLLFGLVSRENGLLERALRLQVIEPRKLHQSLLLDLRRLGKNRLNPAFTLVKSTMQPSVARAFEHSANLAFDAGLPAAGEAELIKAVLLENDPSVASALAALKVDLKELSTYVLQYRPSDDEETSPDARKLSIAEIEERLRQRIVGQDHVIDRILPFLKRMRFGYARRGRPLGVLLFVGPSGTGKTQLAKEIANAVYGSEEQLIFLEMGQFGSEYSKTIFVGAPPGLVGYGEGLLTNGLRDKPEAVVLFDEVEKAHKSVFDVLLRFLDEGQIADPAGPVRDGTRCIIILTSNHALDVLAPLGERQAVAAAGNAGGRESPRTDVREALRATEFFRPEFLNRVDEVILFNAFDQSAYERILRNQLDEERNRLWVEKKIRVSVDESLVQHLVLQSSARAKEGARVCGRMIADLVVIPLIDHLMSDVRKTTDGFHISFVPPGPVRIVPPAKESP